MANVLIILTIICSIISQLPLMLNSTLGLVLKFMWIPFGLFVLIKAGKCFVDNILTPWYVFIIIFTIYLCVINPFGINSYFGADYNNILLSTIICIVSYSFWYCYGSTKLIKLISIVILITGVIFAYELFIQSLRFISLESRAEIYRAKNSAAQILLSCLLITYIFLKNQKGKSKIIVYISIILLTIIIFILKSRATLASLFFVIIYFILHIKNKKVKKNLLWLSFGACLLILVIPSLYNLIVENILFNNRDSTNLDDLSSGRLTIIHDIWNEYLSSPILGLGNTYIDCMPISILIQFGILGFIFVFIFLYKVYTIALKISKYSKIGECAYLLFISYMVNSLFEAQPPFGPGAKCFFVWMFLGFGMAQYIKNPKKVSLKYSINCKNYPKNTNNRLEIN